MRKILMGLAGLGMLVIGAGANASPLSTGTNLATPETGVTEMIDHIQYGYGHRRQGRHYGWDRGRHRGWDNPRRHRGWEHRRGPRHGYYGQPPRHRQWR